MAHTWVVGDIHGCADPLIQLLDRIRDELSPEDSVVFLGDYVDRGPDSKGVVDAIVSFRKEHPGTITLKGNHEQWMLAAFSDFTRTSWLRGMKGVSTVRSWSASAAEALEQAIRDIDSNLPDGDPSVRMPYDLFLDELDTEHRRFFEQLAHVHEDEHGIYSHAGLDPWVESISEQSEYDLLWSSPEEMIETWHGPKTLVVGHRPTHRVNPDLWGRPLLTDHVILLDTCCHATGVLTAIGLPDRTILSAGILQKKQS